jgi:hypothetical protein
MRRPWVAPLQEEPLPEAVAHEDVGHHSEAALAPVKEAGALPQLLPQVMDVLISEEGQWDE